ncbi:MAG: DUF4864 domain-containing protein [Nanohaloarchaea archaeon SW_7_43_1]|nr:MAG: DUF4864 domain-containing protein [Nanohaloarchaea archaeon SW_7_43_1]
MTEKNKIPGPEKDLSPLDAVEIQIKAMANNDEPYKDAGIETAFKFASPKNKSSTGPIERFKKMVKNPRYKYMLNSQSYSVEETDISEKKASIKAEIENKGSTVTYEFNLSAQDSGEHEGCWMTDSVLRID